MIGVPSERVADPVPLAAFDLLVDRCLPAAFPQFYVGDFLGPVYTENTTKAAIDEDLELTRDVFCGLPCFASVQQYGFDIGLEYFELNSPGQLP